MDPVVHFEMPFDDRVRIQRRNMLVTVKTQSLPGEELFTLLLVDLSCIISS